MTLEEAVRRLPARTDVPSDGFEGWIVAELHEQFAGVHLQRPWGRFVVGEVRLDVGGGRVFGQDGLLLSAIKRWAPMQREDALQILRDTKTPYNGS